MHDRLDLFYQHLQANAMWQAQARLDLRQQPIDPPDISRRFHLGHNENIDVLARFLYDGDNVLVGVLGLQVVYAVGPRLLAPVQRFERVDYLRPRRYLLVGRDRIFEVEKYQIGVAGYSLLYHPLATGGRGEFRAP